MPDINTLRERYVRLYGEHPTAPAVLAQIESRLDLRLPADLVSIALFFDGTGINTLPLYGLAADDDSWSILHETLQLRASIGLPQRFIVLAEPPESLIVMNCNEGGRVLWIDATDAQALVAGHPLRKPDQWPTFADFFAYLLDEDEADAV